MYGKLIIDWLWNVRVEELQPDGNWSVRVEELSFGDEANARRLVNNYRHYGYAVTDHRFGAHC